MSQVQRELTFAARRSLQIALLLSLIEAAALGQGLRGFGTPDGKEPLAGFGDPRGESALDRLFPELAAAVTDDDRVNAGREIARTDGNGDGVVTQEEWSESGYQSPDRFKLNDLDGNGKLTVLEHAMRWAQYRMGKQRSAGGDAGRSGKPGNGAENSTDASATWSARSSLQERRAALRREQSENLAIYVLSIYDLDQSGALEQPELRDDATSKLRTVALADGDRNGELTKQELVNWMAARLESQPGSGLPANTPEWFLSSDRDHDGQVMLAEFLQIHSVDETAQFTRFDRNDDGIVTTGELASPMRVNTHYYSTKIPHVIEAEAESQSLLVITDDFVIADIDVQVSIAKNGDDDIELELIGPDGERAALYFDSRAKPWGGGRLFENTTIDDEAPDYSQRLPRPPLALTFRPQGMKQAGLKSLSAFYGRSSRGAWRLSVRNKSQVAGLLESWALLIKPGEAP